MSHTKLRALGKPRLQPIAPSILLIAPSPAVQRSVLGAVSRRNVTVATNADETRRWARATRGPAGAIAAIETCADGDEILGVIKPELRWLRVGIVGVREQMWRDRRAPHQPTVAIVPTLHRLPGILDTFEGQLATRFARTEAFCQELRFQPAWSEMLWRLVPGMSRLELADVLGVSADNVRKELGKMREIAGANTDDELVAAANDGVLFEPFPALASQAVAV